MKPLSGPGMAPDEYGRMAELEESMWWYQGLHGNVLLALRSNAPTPRKLLDAGCGTGGVLRLIKDNFPATSLFGLDISEQACDAARTKSGAQVTQGSVDALPYADQQFDVLVNLDVLGYDLDLDTVMQGFLRVLRPGGLLVLNLPAYQWMLSYHDAAVGQKRRFRRSQAIFMLEKHGFHILNATYWNTILFPLMVVRRKLLPSRAHSDVSPFPQLVNGFFTHVMALERHLIGMGLRFPYGGSMLLIAQRPLN